MGKRAIFVDGASLFAMREALGVENISFVQLFNILTGKVGKQELVDRPFFVLPVGLSGLNKTLRAAGFKVQVAETKESRDDEIIIESIRRLDTKAISEIVIVSADSDYVDVLREKVGDGVKIYWVAVNGSGASLGGTLKDLLGSEFEFVDLANYRDALARASAPILRNVKLVLEGQVTTDVCQRINNFLSEITLTNPKIKGTIEVS